MEGRIDENEDRRRCSFVHPAPSSREPGGRGRGTGRGVLGSGDARIIGPG